MLGPAMRFFVGFPKEGALAQLRTTPMPSLLLLIVALASQPPAPSPGKRQGAEPQQKATQAQQQPAPDIRGTDQSPLRVQRCYINARRGGYEWSNVTLGPGEQSTEQVFSRLTDTERNSLQTSGKVSFVLMGWIDYWDAFNDPQQQMIGAFIEFTAGPEAIAYGSATVARPIADMPRNLGRMVRENPWPLDEPDPTGQA